MAFADFKHSYEHQYLDLLATLVGDCGSVELDRTGVGTTRRFGAQIGHNLFEGFPILTTKKLFIRGVTEELLWFLRGETNIASLKERKVNIWNEWADENLDLGPVYGEMWTRWPAPDGSTVNQIENVIDELKTNPESRRLVVSGWNPTLLPNPDIAPSENPKLGRQALPPCHTMFQFFAQRMSAQERADFGSKCMGASVEKSDIEGMDALGIPSYALDCQLYQRSGDIFLGVPFNAISYAALLTLIANKVGMAPRNFVHSFGDLHLYSNHTEQAKTQLERQPLAMPKMILDDKAKKAGFSELTADMFQVRGYESWSAISAPVAV